MHLHRTRLIEEMTSEKRSIYIITIVHLVMVGIVLFIAHILLSGKIEENKKLCIFCIYGYFLCSLGLIYFVHKKWKEYFTHTEEYFFTDELTQLPNITAFVRDFERYINKDDTFFMKMIMVETTNQNEINAVFGISAVYEMQKEIALFFQNLLNVQIKIYKIDLNALLILFPKNYIFDFSQIQKPKQVIRINDIPVYFEIACGECEYPQDGKTAFELLQRASCAIQVAKNEHTIFYKYEHKQERSQRIILLGQMQEAINSHEIIFYYQPIIDVNGSITEMEALARWDHPQYGMLPPSSFINDLEQTGISSFLINYSLEYNLRNLRNLHRGGFKQKMAINISIMDLRQDYFSQIVLTHLDKNDLKPSDLILEITERGFLAEDEKINRNINELSQRGVLFHIDDFGVGFASFGNLRKNGIRSIKIDHSFIEDLSQNETNQALVDCLVKMAKKLGISTVAEGVESEESIEQLKKMGVDYLQGFAIARPMPFEELCIWLQQYQK